MTASFSPVLRAEDVSKIPAFGIRQSDGSALQREPKSPCRFDAQYLGPAKPAKMQSVAQVVAPRRAKVKAEPGGGAGSPAREENAGGSSSSNAPSQKQQTAAQEDKPQQVVPQASGAAPKPQHQPRHADHLCKYCAYPDIQ